METYTLYQIESDALSPVPERYKVPYGAVLSVADGDEIQAAQVVANWDPHTHPVITEVAGIVAFSDIVEGVTVHRHTDAFTGITDLVITDPKQRGAAAKDLRPTMRLVDEEGQELHLPGTDIPAHYFLPPKAIINVAADDSVKIGDVIARMPQESLKTRDITGGLPRVAELFEARTPKDAAILAEASGSVS